MLRQKKIETNTRIMVMNVNGFRDEYAEKIDQMIEFFKNNKIDSAILSKTNGKLAMRNASTMSLKYNNQEEK